MVKVDMDAWERAKPHIQKALDAGENTHSLEDVFTGIESGDYQFWHFRGAFAVTQIHEYPQKKVFDFWLMAGRGRLAMKIIEPVAWRWAQDQGCVMAKGSAVYRQGWDRMVPPSYKKGWIVFSKNA